MIWHGKCKILADEKWTDMGCKWRIAFAFCPWSVCHDGDARGERKTDEAGAHELPQEVEPFSGGDNGN
jgi:hypothetical protein